MFRVTLIGCLSWQREVAQLKKPFSAIIGSGDQTSTCNGETAYGSVYASRSSGDQGAAIVFGVLGSLSHAPGLETSTASRPARPRRALAAAAAALGVASHDLVRRRLLAGA